MSGIASIYNLDGRPVDLELLRRMTEVIAESGPDGVGHWIGGSVGLGHRMLHTTPESLAEQQPLSDESGVLCLTLDGRVDNREELRAALERASARLRDETDAELVLRAYELWGEECPKKIIGDFVFAIWDGRKRQLFCARDPIGLKSLYYYTDSRVFICGSELRQLFESAAVPKQPNEIVIGEYLALCPSFTEETLFRHIKRLLPAHGLVIREGHIRTWRYWEPDPSHIIRHKTDTEYAEHFLALFKEAVRCRMRVIGPIGFELSGGLDSSSVVSLAQAMRCAGEVPSINQEIFSLVFPGQACDESDYIRAVADRWGIKPQLFAPDHLQLSWYSKELARYSDFPQYPNGVAFYGYLMQARNQGVRVVFAGDGGDEWLTGSFYHYADYLRRMQWLKLYQQLRADRQFNKGEKVPAVIFPDLALLRVGVTPLLPRVVRRLLKLRRRMRPCNEWINRDFARRIKLADNIHQMPAPRRFPSFAQEDIARNLSSGWMLHGNDLGIHIESMFQIERRLPFFDRRLIEFALALPEEQRWRERETKFVLRKAMRGLLPEVVRQRTSKADFSYLFAETVPALAQRKDVFGELQIAKAGWVDATASHKMFRRMINLYVQNDPKYMSCIWPLWMILGIELWYRNLSSPPKQNSASFRLVLQTN